MPYKDPEKRKEYLRQWNEQHPEYGRNHARKWASEHREQMTERTRIWRLNNPERAKEAQRRQYKKSPEKEREYRKRWAEKNPEKKRAQNHKDRARKSSVVITLTPETEKEILQKGCLFCGTHTDLVIAHDTAVVKGGNTTRGNVFCLCRSCNSKMRTKSLKDMISQLRLH